MSLFEHHHDTAEAVAVREEDAAARVKRLRQLMGELVVKIENEEGRSHHRQRLEEGLTARAFVHTELRALFKRIDTDGNGNIDAKGAAHKRAAIARSLSPPNRHTTWRRYHRASRRAADGARHDRVDAGRGHAPGHLRSER
jgi:hypothetical protein